MAAGTGLGEALLVPDGDRFVSVPERGRTRGFRAQQRAGDGAARIFAQPPSAGRRRTRELRTGRVRPRDRRPLRLSHHFDRRARIGEGSEVGRAREGRSERGDQRARACPGRVTSPPTPSICSRLRTAPKQGTWRSRDSRSAVSICPAVSPTRSCPEGAPFSQRDAQQGKNAALARTRPGVHREGRTHRPGRRGTARRRTRAQLRPKRRLSSGVCGACDAAARCVKEAPPKND